MDKWLINFESITQDFPDISDYENFYTHCAIYIQKNTEKHDKYKTILLRALKTFEREVLISITYRLLNIIQGSYLVEVSTVNSHFESDYLKNEVLWYIAKNKLIEFKDLVLKCLYDTNYNSKGLYPAIKNIISIDELNTFLNIKDIFFLEKQLDVMIGTGHYHNLKYFISLIGSKYNNICYKTSLLLTQLVDTNYENEDILCLNNQFIKFKKQIRVESLSNFVFYFFDFFENQIEILDCINENDIEMLSQLLITYIEPHKVFNLTNRRIHILNTPKKQNQVDFESNVYEEKNFDYLFTKNYYKAFMDCLEI
ncbi:hypothetical protein COBT_000704 [Conglomerata obtusa]